MVESIKSILEDLKQKGAAPEAISDLEIAMEDFMTAVKSGESKRAAAAFRSAVTLASAADPLADAAMGD